MRTVLALLMVLAVLTSLLVAETGADPTADPDPATAEDEELEELRRAARDEAAAEEEEPEGEETTFVSGALGLQALNPEISVTGDFLSSYSFGSHVDQHFRNQLRNLGLHLESYLDPYSRFKAAVEFNPEEGAELGEAYFTRFGLFDNLALTLGKFRQQFGVVNRWHKHGLDQVDFPLPLRQIFGPGGLNQIGFSIDWQMPPLRNSVQELTAQITNGENPRMFGQNARNFPAFLLHYRNYRDLSKDTYLELGLTGLGGSNDTWQVAGEGNETVEATRNLSTLVWGADLTLLWEPTDRMRYRNWLWRTEFYLANKRVLAPDGSGEATLSPWGAYTYVQTKVSRTLELGVRLDYYEPDSRDFPGDPYWPLATSIPDSRQILIAVYTTWYQSPWVRWRLEYDYQGNGDLGPDDNTVWLQCTFAAGPHKHERY